MVVSADGKGVTCTFNPAEVGLSSGDQVGVSLETQAGLKAKKEVGIADDAPDAGFFSYTLK